MFLDKSLEVYLEILDGLLETWVGPGWLLATIVERADSL